MAQVVDSVASQMIRDLQLKDVEDLSEVMEVVDEVMSLLSVLKRIHWLLNHSYTNALVARSAETIRDLAYKIEDVLETCSVDAAEMVQKKESGSSRRFSWKSYLRKCFPAQDDGYVLEKIEAKISELDRDIVKFCKDFPEGATGKTSDEPPLVASRGQLWLRQMHPPSNKRHFVGMNDELDKLVSLVVEKENLVVEKENLVISIWGVPGLGKTTIARNIYNHPKVRDNFKAFAWVSFTEGCEINNILLKILRQLGPRKVNETAQDETMIDQLKEVQTQKNCLIVLDNIQDTDHWGQLSPAFQVEGGVSVVLLTTHETNVANDIYHHKLTFLDEKEGWDLLKKHAFPKKDGPGPSYLAKLILPGY